MPKLIAGLPGQDQIVAPELKWHFRITIDGQRQEKTTDDDTGSVLTDDATGEPLYDKVNE